VRVAGPSVVGLLQGSAASHPTVKMALNRHWAIRRMKKAARRGRYLAAEIVSPEGDVVIVAGLRKLASFFWKFLDVCATYS